MLFTMLALIAVIAFVVLVCYAVMTLIQMRRTLQRMDEMMVNTERELTPLLGNLRESSDRIKISVVHLQKGIYRAEGLLEAIGEVGESIRSVNDLLRSTSGRSLNQGMALWAGFQAFRKFFKKPQETEGE